MGKGDIKSKRGKIVNGSFGVRRRKKKANIAVPNVVAAKESVKSAVEKELVKESAVKEVAKAPAKKKEKAKK